MKNIGTQENGNLIKFLFPKRRKHDRRKEKKNVFLFVSKTLKNEKWIEEFFFGLLLIPDSLVTLLDIKKTAESRGEKI